MPGLQHVTKVPHRLVDRQELPVVGTVFCCAGLSFLEKARGCQTSSTRCWTTAPKAVVEASRTKASGAVACGWDRRAALDKLALHSLKAATSASLQVTGCEPLTLGPERTS